MTTAEAKADYEEYVNTPGKLSLNAFRTKLPFNINHGLSGFDISSLIDPDDYVIDYDVYLPSKDKNLQRPFVWTLEQKQELILSILKGIRLAPITVIQFRDDTNRHLRKVTLKIIDGKQRLSTLISFYKGEFSISFNDKDWFFNDLSNQAKREIDGCLHVDCGYEYMDTPIPDDVKITWFEMINFAGTLQDKAHLENLKS